MGPAPRRNNPQSLRRPGRDEDDEKSPDVNRQIRAMEQRAQQVMSNVQNTVLKAEDRVDNIHHLQEQTAALQTEASNFEKSANKSQAQQLALLIKERMMMILLIGIPVIIITLLLCGHF